MPTQKWIRWSARVVKESLVEVLAGDVLAIVSKADDLMIILEQLSAVRF